MKHNIILTLITLCQPIYLYGAEKKLLHCTVKDSAFYAQQALQAQEYNQNIPLFSLPPEDFDYVMESLINPKTPMNPCIKDCLSLNATCKSLNDIPYLAKFLQRYSHTEKNESMKKLLWKTNVFSYWNHRNALLLLTYAGANHDAHSDSPLLRKAIHQNDSDMIKVLFEHKVDPNSKDSMEWPIFFSIKTPEIGQLFIDNRLDIHASSNFCLPNVLWSCLIHNRSANLIAFYLNKGIDPRKINSYNACILHLLPLWDWQDMETVKLLLKTIPDMINTVNQNGETPLDIAEKPFFKKQELIKLFKKAGALTAQELKNQQGK